MTSEDINITADSADPCDHQVDDSTPASAPAPATSPAADRRRTRITGLCVLPVLAALLALSAGYLRFDLGSRGSDQVRNQVLEAAQRGVVTMLSYTPEDAEQTLDSARHLMTGPFRDEYSKLINDVVIPGAKQRRIAATATVAAAAPQSITATHASVLVYIDQDTTMDGQPPTRSTSAAEVTLDKTSGSWLITGFTPK